MAMSSISKPHLSAASAKRLGGEIKRRRQALGLSQADVGRPLTRAYVSAIEQGLCSPSLATLVQIAERLNTSPAELLDSVNPGLALVYTGRHATNRKRRADPYVT
jgi:transcriptional regulator with XRE-family HTH domain